MHDCMHTSAPLDTLPTCGIVAVVVPGVGQGVAPRGTCARPLLCHPLQLGVQQLLLGCREGRRRS